MQTNSLPLASGIHKLFPTIRRRLLVSKKGNPMYNTSSIALASSSTPFGRLFAAIDRLLLAYAEITIRNGDIPRSNV